MITSTPLYTTCQCYSSQQHLNDMLRYLVFVSHLQRTPRSYISLSLLIVILVKHVRETQQRYLSLTLDCHYTLGSQPLAKVTVGRVRPKCCQVYGTWEGYDSSAGTCGVHGKGTAAVLTSIRCVRRVRRQCCQVYGTWEGYDSSGVRYTVRVEKMQVLETSRNVTARNLYLKTSEMGAEVGVRVGGGRGG